MRNRWLALCLLRHVHNWFTLGELSYSMLLFTARIPLKCIQIIKAMAMLMPVYSTMSKKIEVEHKKEAHTDA